MGRINSVLKNKTGFTLLELMIVVSIVGVLGALGLSHYQGRIEESKYHKSLADIQSIANQVIQRNSEIGSYPEDLSELGLGAMEDPWGNSYEFLNIETATGKGKMRKDHNLVPVNTDFDLYSKGPDGKSSSPFTAAASRDDIVRANDGAFFGKVSDY